MKKAFKYIINIALTIFVCLLIFSLPIRIDKTIAAVEIALDDKSYCRPVNVIINGTYHWRMLGDDKFDGNIKFDTYPLTMKNELEQGKGLPTLKLTKGSDSLDYGEWMNSTIFGYIHTKAFFNRFIVQVFESYKTPEGGSGGSWDTKDGKCIVGPAINREEALDILKKISNERLPPYEYWME